MRGRERRDISIDLTVSTSGYAPGDVVGGLIEFENALDSALGSGLINSVLIYDNSKQDKNYTLYIFDDKPAEIADGDAFSSLSAADLRKLCAPPIEITTLKVIGTHGYSSVAEKKIVVESKARTTAAASGGYNLTGTPPGRNGWLYGYLVCDEAPTYADPTDVTLRVIFERD